MIKTMTSIVLIFACSIFTNAQQVNKKISETLETEILSSSNEAEHLVWIFFNDKGNDTEIYFSNPELVVSKKSIDRRNKMISKKSSPISYTDFPVYSDYISEIESTGFSLKQKSRWFNAISGYADLNEIQSIASLPFVKKIDIVRKYKKSGQPIEDRNKTEVSKSGDELSGDHMYNYGQSFTQLNQINVPAIHDLGYTGQGVTICLMDAGFNRLTHEVFDNMNIIAAWDFVNNDPNVGDEGDMGTGTHGTETLSTIGGFKEGQLIGPAFGSDFILAKTENTDSETPVEEDNWIAALEWADSIGVDVTSTSLIYLEFDPPFQSYTWQDMDGNTALITIAADIAAGIGIVVVNSAGNNGFNANHNTLGAPADGDSVISVGAVESTGERSGFSSVGPTVDGRIKPDVMAMGDGVYVASPYDDHGYTTSSGTSFSCPLTAGVAALILCYNPSLTPMQVREALRNTASQSSDPDNLYGWGIIDGLAALDYYQLPVELTLFTGSSKNGNVNLLWVTATEVNTQGFEIQRSSDTENFRKIGFVEASGNSVKPITYEYKDESPVAQTVYYRLKIIDFDGTYSYSETIQVNGIFPSEAELYQNYPNPFNPSTTISYSVPISSPVRIELFNVLGERIKVLSEGDVEAGFHSLNFNAGNLPSGIYIVNLITEEGSNRIKINLLK